MTYAARLKEHPTYETVKGYWQRHEEAMTYPRGWEGPIVTMLRGWLAYADLHHARYERGIGDDYVMGPYWADLGRAILRLLDGDTGRLDCGAVSDLVHSVLAAEGLDVDA